MLTHILKWGWSRNRQQPPTRNQTGYWGGRCQKWQSLGLLRDFPCRTEADISEGNSGTRLSASSMSAQLAHCILERKRAYTSPYKPTSLLLSTHGKLLETEHPYFFALIKLFLLSQSYCQLLSSMKKKKNSDFFFFFFFTIKRFCPWSLFIDQKTKQKKKTQCSEWVNTLMHGSPVLETYWSWTIRYQAWALFREGRGGERSFRSVGKVCNTRQPQWLHH